jgi:hypothetical protein
MKRHRFGKHAFLAIVTVAGLISVPIARAEPLSSSPAPLVPIQVLSARKVFLSNAGLVGNSMVAFNRFAKTKAGVPYADFVAAMKSWGQYDCVATPADSDVVFEFRVESYFYILSGLPSYSTFLSVVILDTKTHFVLWTVESPPVDITIKFDQNVDTAVTNLLDSMKALVATGSDAGKQ